ncbi:MAG: hypothetical protein AAGC60_18305 [Acidobacteriota bacterium]
MTRSSHLPRAAAATVALVIVALYAPGLGRGFVSEDFLILRRLHDGGWRLAFEHFTGPWLGVTFVGFYRPLASALLDAQIALFGVRPAPLLGVQLLVHLLNTALVGRLLWRLGGRTGPAIAGAALFALHPLHPNAVLFVASFATLYAAAGVLTALLLHLRGRRLGATCALAAALLCYEQAAVAPALLLALDLLTPRAPQKLDARRLGALARHHAPYWLVLGVYLAVRRLALGASVGGYDGFRARLTPERWPELLRDLGHDLVLTVSPDVVPTVPAWLWIGGLGAVAATLIAGVAGVVRRHAAPPLRLAALGLTWTIVALAPFAFTGIVPGNGRYLYLSVAGSALVVVAAGRVLARGARRLGARHLGGRTLGARTLGARTLGARHLEAILPTVLALLFAVALAGLVRLHLDSSDTAARLQAALVDAPPGTLLVADRPEFLELAGRNAAQIVHWGLADAVRPPFVEPSRARMVLPLPDALGAPSLFHLARQLPDVRIVRWTGDSVVQVYEVAADLNEMPSRLVTHPNRPPEIAYRGNPARRHRLVLLTAGAPHVSAAPPPPTSGFVDVSIPTRWLDSMDRLYPGAPVWAWIEALDRDGRVVAASQIHAFSGVE